jgi:hypothetical protein
VPIGAIAFVGVLALVAAWTERQRALAQRAAGHPDEVLLHQTALAAVEQARTQIHVARRAAEALRQYSVSFDVQAKLASAFAEELPPQPKPSPGKAGKQMFFLVDSQEHLPALKEAVDQLVPASAGRGSAGEPPVARVALRHAMDADGGLWTASKALGVLESHGWRSDSERPLNVVGNLLAAMVRDGEIQRAGRGMYTSLRRPPSTAAEYEVAPGVFAREASTGVWIITGIDADAGSVDAEDAA